MTRPPQTPGALLATAAFVLVFVTASSTWAEPPKAELGAARVVAKSDAPPGDEVKREAIAANAPKDEALTGAALEGEDVNEKEPALDVAPPPPLDPVERPPAFTTGDAGSFLWSFVKSMLMLGLVLALIYLVLHKGLGRLMQRTQMGKRMRVVERIALDQRRALYLIEVDGQEVLLAGSDAAMVAVELPRNKEREPPSSAASPAVRFSTDLGKTGRPPPVTGGLSEDGSKVQTPAGVRSRESAEG